MSHVLEDCGEFFFQNDFWWTIEHPWQEGMKLSDTYFLVDMSTDGGSTESSTKGRGKQ